MKLKAGQLIKKFKAKNGKEVVLRAVKYSDLRQLLSYYNRLMDEDVLLMHARKKSMKEEKEWLKNKLKQMKKGRTAFAVAEINKNIVGGADLRRGAGDRSSHVCEFGIALQKNYRGFGIGKEMTSQIIKIAKRMKYKIMLLGVFADNKAAIKLYKKLGFKQVARLPKIFLYKGRYVDDIWMIKKL